MLPVLYYSAHYKTVSLKLRKEAAWQARQKAMHNWRFWFAMGFWLTCVLTCALLQEKLFHSHDTAFGAGIGFFVGLSYYSWTLHKIAMPYYIDILKQELKRSGPNLIEDQLDNN